MHALRPLSLIKSGSLNKLRLSIWPPASYCKLGINRTGMDGLCKLPDSHLHNELGRTSTVGKCGVAGAAVIDDCFHEGNDCDNNS